MAPFILTFLMSSELIGFPFLSIAPSATMMMLRREPRFLVWSRTKENMVSVTKLLDRKGISSRAGRGVSKGEIRRRYLAEPATQVLLPVIIWRTLRNKHPVSPTGQRGDKGQVSETRARSVAPGATLHQQPLPFLTRPSPIATERSEEPRFILGARGRAPLVPLISGILSLKSPSIHAHLPQRLRISERCLLFHTCMCGMGRLRGDGERQAPQEECVHLQSATTGRPPWTPQGRGKGYCLVHGINEPRWGILPTVPAHHF